jgi:hypothetical protein
MVPPMTAPRIGATQNSQSWLRARLPPNTALPRLRAGLTDAFETGMAAEAWILLYITELRARFTFLIEAEVLRSETILL